jgi:hypothetical protein
MNTDKIETVQVGDIIDWTSVVHGVRQYRVVESWTDSEPKRLLLTTVEYSGKCYVATVDDCRIVERGSEESRFFKCKPLGGSYAPNAGRVAEPCRHPVALDHEI